jgi:hypothetical protein
MCFWGFEMYEIQICEAECKTDEEKRPLYAVDNLELMMSHDVGFGGESMTMRAAERATSDDDQQLACPLECVIASPVISYVQLLPKYRRKHPHPTVLPQKHHNHVFLRSRSHRSFAAQLGRSIHHCWQPCHKRARRAGPSQPTR